MSSTIAEQREIVDRRARRYAAIRARLTREEWVLIDQFRGLRRALGIPQRALDDRIGCSDGLTEKIEAGTRRPSSKALVEMAQALGAHILVVPHIPMRRIA